jgi:hypothetical protein
MIGRNPVQPGAAPWAAAAESISSMVVMAHQV